MTARRRIVAWTAAVIAAAATGYAFGVATDAGSPAAVDTPAVPTPKLDLGPSPSPAAAEEYELPRK